MGGLDRFVVYFDPVLFGSEEHALRRATFGSDRLRYRPKEFWVSPVIGP